MNTEKLNSIHIVQISRSVESSHNVLTLPNKGVMSQWPCVALLGILHALPPTASPITTKSWVLGLTDRSPNGAVLEGMARVPCVAS